MTHMPSPTRTLVACLLALLLAAPLTAAAQEQGGAEQQTDAKQPTPLPELQKRVQEAFQSEDYEKAVLNLQRMRQQLPFNGKLLYELAAAYALKGDAQRAFNTLVMLQQQGLAYSPKDDPRFESIKQYQLFGYLGDLLEKNAGPFDRADPALRADTGLRWPHAIARVGEAGDFLIAGLGQGRIARVGPEGEAGTFYEPGDGEGPGGISALAIDAERGHVWAAGTAIREDDRGLSINMQAAALYRFDLESGELQARFPIGDDKPLPHLFNEIAVSPDGKVYVADALSPLIYVHEPGKDALEAYLGAPRLSGFHGLAISPDGKYLFVSDWVAGVFRIRVEDTHVIPLAHDPTVNLGGIHSLSYKDGELFAVQTGTRPKRVGRIQLSESLDKAVAMFPLSAAETEYDHPGLGMLAGDGFFFIANSGWTMTGRPSDGRAEAVVLRADPDLDRDRKTPATIRKDYNMSPEEMYPEGVKAPFRPDTDADEGDGEDGGS